ncbi:hypothetical protein DFJ74DRAFT_688110 [Hyaloraphidium curvatum]|nr:hypothetical protein DFJ74DRAFT_688110 [Hyaloraphidium curvatum]
MTTASPETGPPRQKEAPPSFLTSTRRRFKFPAPVPRGTAGGSGTSAAPQRTEERTEPQISSDSRNEPPQKGESSASDIAEDLAALSLKGSPDRGAPRGERGLKRIMETAPQPSPGSPMVPWPRLVEYKGAKALSLEESISLAAGVADGPADGGEAPRRKPTANYVKALEAANVFLNARFNSVLADFETSSEDEGSREGSEPGDADEEM